MLRGSRLLFVDEGEVMWAAKSLALAEDGGETEVSVKAAFVGWRHQLRKARAFDPHDPRDLTLLVDALRDSGQLSGLRPDPAQVSPSRTTYVNQQAFVFEEVEAVPLTVLLPTFRTSLTGQSDLAGPSTHLWVLGPGLQEPSPPRPVVLLEQHSVRSVSQATRMMRAMGVPLEPGRVNPRHTARDDGLLTTHEDMVGWLEAGGAEVERSRGVTVLYQVVQAVMFDAGERDLSCLLAYPLFLAETS